VRSSYCRRGGRLLGWLSSAFCRAGSDLAPRSSRPDSGMGRAAQHFRACRPVAAALGSGGIDGRGEAVPAYCRPRPDSLDAARVARAAIESLRKISATASSPGLWYLLLGLPGSLRKDGEHVDSMIGHRTLRGTAPLGWAVSTPHDVLNTVPAPLSGCAFRDGPRCSPKNGRPAHAFTIMLRDGPQPHSPNAGWPESAMAGALGLGIGRTAPVPPRVSSPIRGSATVALAPGYPTLARACSSIRLACLNPRRAAVRGPAGAHATAARLTGWPSRSPDGARVETGARDDRRSASRVVSIGARTRFAGFRSSAQKRPHGRVARNSPWQIASRHQPSALTQQPPWVRQARR